MQPPKVSVLLPVYNAERFLREAIDSVLHQTFDDFELLVLNDGSTDGSVAIIESYTDPRVRHLPNVKNRGLIFTLNRGIELAAGQYIARMDADDICLPERFQKQVAFLDKYKDIAVVAATLEMMSESGAPLPPWKDDRKHTDPDEIARQLLTANCIGHPSIMARSSIMKVYRYDEDQVEAEDYDLWLRLAADGKRIAKIAEPQLRYRVLDQGLTRKDRLSGFERLARTKGKFLARRRREDKMNDYCRWLEERYQWDLIRAKIKKWLSI